MKRSLLFMLLCFVSVNLLAQSKVYCEIVERNPTSKKVKVTIDFGQKKDKKTKSSQTLVDEKGDVVIFNSKIDALNHLDSLGWNFLQAYTIVYGGSSGGTGSTSSEIHWLLYKEVKDGEDPYKGLITKEQHENINMELND